MTVVVAAVVLLGVSASLWDVRTRRVPNLLTFGAALTALAYRGIAEWPHGLVSSSGGWAVGLLLFLPLFALRGMGAGDVKLLAAFGAWLGPAGAFWTAIYGAIAGGAVAVVMLLRRGALRQTFDNIWSLLMFFRVVGVRPHPTLTLDSPEALRLPYAVPLSIGAIVAMWLGR